MTAGSECFVCGQNNFDVFESHLVAFSGEYGYPGPSVILYLCVNCHRIVHRCFWALISKDSEVVIGRYLAQLETILPPSLFPILKEELLSAKENVERQHLMMNSAKPGSANVDRRCSLCNCANPDLLEEHDLGAWSNYPVLATENIDVCANCHRILIKFYEKKALPTSQQSKALLQKYLTQFWESLSTQTKNDLTSFLM